MNSSPHMLIVVGARPQFIKAAALQREMVRDGGWRATWVHTGQHHDETLSAQFFRELGLPSPDVQLSPRTSSRELRMGDMMHGIRKAIQSHQPKWVLVFGDTDSTLAGAWAAAAEEVPLVHVEAGLRSHQWSMPEEVNRILTDRLSSVLVCPTDAAVEHLRQEGIVNDDNPTALSPRPTLRRVLRTGDIMHDNAVHFGSSWPEDARGSGDVLLTMHRPSNVDDPKRLELWLTTICRWLEQSGNKAVFPVHPRTSAVLDRSWSGWRHDLELGGIAVKAPLGYLDLLAATCAAPLVLTDSGGVQKEAYSLGTRCVVLRDTTEWVEQVECGHSALAGHPSQLVQVASDMLSLGRFQTGNLYGNGYAAAEILRCLRPQFASS